MRAANPRRTPRRGRPAATGCSSSPPWPSGSSSASPSASPTRRPTTDETAYLRSGDLARWRATASSGTASPSCTSRRSSRSCWALANEVFDDPHTGTVVLTLVVEHGARPPARRAGPAHRRPDRGRRHRLGGGHRAGPVDEPRQPRGRAPRPMYLLLVATAVWCVVSAAADDAGRARAVRVAAGGPARRPRLPDPPRGPVLRRAARAGGRCSSALGRRGARAVVRRAGRRAPLAACFAVPLLLCIAPYAAYLYGAHRQGPAQRQDAGRLDRGLARGRPGRSGRARQRAVGARRHGLHFANTERTSLPALAAADPAGYAAIVGTNVVELGRGDRRPRDEPGAVLGAAAVPAVGPGGHRGLAGAALVGRPPRPGRRGAARGHRARVLRAAPVPGGDDRARHGVRRRRRARRSVGPWVKPVVAGGLVLLVLSSVAGFRSSGAGWWHPSEGLDQREAGEWIAANAGPDDRIMTRSMVVEFYAERPAMAIPYAEMDEIIAYARHYGAPLHRRRLVHDRALAAAARTAEGLLLQWRPGCGSCGRSGSRGGPPASTPSNRPRPTGDRWARRSASSATAERRIRAFATPTRGDLA